jgi:hypothetical protein
MAQARPPYIPNFPCQKPDCKGRYLVEECYPYNYYEYKCYACDHVIAEWKPGQEKWQRVQAQVLITPTTVVMVRKGVRLEGMGGD